jgi:hypothetical protein
MIGAGLKVETREFDVVVAGDPLEGPDTGPSMTTR